MGPDSPRRVPTATGTPAAMGRSGYGWATRARPAARSPPGDRAPNGVGGPNGDRAPNGDGGPA